MRKFYSLVLMATALLIGTNAWATTQEQIQSAFNAGTDITLDGDVVVTSPLQMYATSTETGKTVNLYLNGKTISTTSAKAIIELYKGTLNITGPGRIVTTAKSEAIKVFGYTEDVADWSVLNIGDGVSVESTGASGANAISVLGFYGAQYYAYVTKEHAGEVFNGEGGRLNYIGDTNYETLKGAYYVSKGKKVQCTKKGGTVNALYSNNTIDYYTSWPKASAVKSQVVGSETIEWCSIGENSKAFGVVINVKKGAFVYGDKYGIKINGTIAYNGTNIPYVHIENGAEVKAAATANEATAVYSSGYGKFVIEGYVHGSTGVYVKAGQVYVEDGAKIQSDNNTGSGIEAINKGSGINAGGNAIAIEGDNGAYSNEGISVEVNGGTIIAGEGGYAVQNLNNAETQANPNAVEINGGTFTGGAAGSVAIDNESGKVVNVDLEGGTFTGDIETLIAAAGADNVIGQVVSQEGGQATVVIAPKEAGDEVEQPATPQEKQDFAFVNDMSNDIVKLDATTANIAKTLPAGETVVKYLSLTGTGAYTSTVTVEAGKTLKVGQIVMNAKGRIIVEAGAKLIVSGANGIFADDIENLVLKTSEAEQAIFLLNPAVANNKHPKATVEFISKSFVKTGSTEWARQCFGIPSIGALTDVDTEGNVPTVFGVFNYDTNTWDKVAGINKAPYTEDWSKFANPFEHYQMINYAENPGTKVIMKGALVGNENPQLYVRGNFWNGYANSFMGPMNMEKLIDMIPNTVQKAIYLLDLTTSEFRWEPYSLAFMEPEDAINPLQPFLLRNSLAADNIDIDYADAVYYTPAGSGETKPGAAPAPRRAVNDMTKAKLIVKGEGCIDRVGVVEGEDFSAEFDNGYDAAKYMNEGFNMYVSADEKMSIFATDDLNNTYVGLQAVKGGNYTIEFANVQGAELTLIDHETGAQVAMVEGATYEFTAEANSTNDYRFEIVSAAKMPTAIENAEAVKSVKGIYTITGQYVGEMSVWNTLPAGIYVVNGEKLVK